MGEIARKLVQAAEHAEIPTSTLTYRLIFSRQQHRFEERGEGDAPYDTNIVCVNADRLPQLRAALGAVPLAGRYTIGVWFWEIAHFPPELHSAFDFVDEVWVASDFVRQTIAAATQKPVRIVPLPLESPQPPAMSRQQLGLPEGFTFLFVFDYFSVFERKNPLGLVDAFKRAFAPGEGPTLVIKSINGDHDSRSVQRLRSAAADRPDIRLWDGYVSHDQKNALMAGCDSYVSLHRSEGLGLTMAEAMSLRKPVIATAYSGNLAFMSEENSYPVRFSMMPIPKGCDPYTRGVKWAEPNVAHAAELMRRVYERPDEAREVGERAASDIREQHSIERSAEFLRERLNEISTSDRRWLEVRGPVDHAAATASTPPGASLVGGPLRPVRLLRRLLRRLLWPDLVEQRQLDAALVESLRSVERISRAELVAISQELKLLTEHVQGLERVVEELARRQRQS